MKTTRFRSRPLPPGSGAQLRERIAQLHRDDPLSAVDARATVRRVAAVAWQLGLPSTVYRGGLDLRGWEVDHVWLDVDGRVVDAAFPLFVEDFVEVLRRFVAGDSSDDELALAAAGAGVDERVLGVFPPTTGYLGRPVWSQRS